MGTKEQFEHLQNKIQSSINSFSVRRGKNKTKTFILKLAVTLLSSISTVILGLNLSEWNTPENKYLIKNIALVISAIITVISWLDAFYNHKQLWVSFNNTVNALRELQLKNEMRLLQEREITEQEVEQLRVDYQKILNQVNDIWTKLRTDK